MPRLNIWKSLLERALARRDLSDADVETVQSLMEGKTGDILLDAAELPVDVARSLLDDPKIKGGDRAILALRVLGMKSADTLDLQQLYDTKVNTPIEFASVLLSSARSTPNAELLWNERWYPVVVIGELVESERVVQHANVQLRLSVGQHHIGYMQQVDPNLFRTPQGKEQSRTVLEILRALGFRPVQTPPGEYNLRLVRAERDGEESGRQVMVRGSVLERGVTWFSNGLSEVTLGAPDVPRRCVVEPESFERGDSEGFYPGRTGGNFGDNVSRLPLIRVFSFDLKRYVFVDIDDVADYDFDTEAIEKLYLPSDMRAVLRRVFEAGQGKVFGDLIRNKYGGIVILACGSPGVGKTMTAEAYAEVTGRPLYVLEFGELGTRVNEIEHNLEIIFARVVRWRAVLQFDECEIFLTQRGDDLERSAIVGIFLRMLDYYEGLLFLTTNRPDVLDDAIKSRVMLRLDYPDLTDHARQQVWQAMLEAAHIELIDGDEAMPRLASHELNGRQIRNLVRLTKIIHTEPKLKVEAIESLLQYLSR